MATGLSLLPLLLGAKDDLGLQVLGRSVFGLVLATPHVAAFASLRTGPAARPPLLLASVLLSFVSMGVSLAGAGIVFVPSVILYAIGFAVALRHAPDRAVRRAALLLSVIAIGSAALLPYAFLRLYSGQPEEHCWETVRYADGRVETREVAASGTDGMGLSFQPDGLGVSSQQGHCVGDVVTAAEAGQGLEFWALGMAGLGVVWLAGARRPEL